MLPYLKNKREGAMSGPVELIEREMDEGTESSYDMLDAIVDDMLDAFKVKNKKLLKMALEALVEHIQDIDEVEDEKAEKEKKESKEKDEKEDKEDKPKKKAAKKK